MTHGAMVLPIVTRGMIEPSAMRRFSSKNAFRVIMESLSEAKVVDLAINIAQKNPIDFILFRWKELSSTSVINFIKMLLGRCWHVQYDYVKDQDTNKFSINHELGRKASLFLKAYLE